MMLLTPLFLTFCAVSVSALGPAPGQFKNLITFGDSYTDVGSPGDNGTAWPVYAADYGNFSLFPFAKSGAVCSLNLTNRPFPSVVQYQIPTFIAEKANGSLPPLDPEESIYTLWIGTNDVGRASIITGDQEPGVTLVDVVECAVSWVSTMYNNGARNFLFQNVSLAFRSGIKYKQSLGSRCFRCKRRSSTRMSRTRIVTGHTRTMQPSGISS